MYTLINPISDRFGYSLKGNFKCAYKNEKIYLIVGLVPMAVVIVLFILSVTAFRELFTPSGALKAGMVDFVYKDGEMQMTMSSGSVGMSMGIFSFQFAFILFGVALLAYIILLIVMRTGRHFRFEADGIKMSVYYPGGKADTFRLDDVVSVDYKERKAFLGTRGYNVTVVTKKRSYDYRLIHDHLSRSEGIAGTPFNIPKEYSEMPPEEKDQIY